MSLIWQMTTRVTLGQHIFNCLELSSFFEIGYRKKDLPDEIYIALSAAFYNLSIL